jgi:hypothetical protein
MKQLCSALIILKTIFNFEQLTEVFGVTIRDGEFAFKKLATAAGKLYITLTGEDDPDKPCDVSLCNFENGREAAKRFPNVYEAAQYLQSGRAYEELYPLYMTVKNDRECVYMHDYFIIASSSDGQVAYLKESGGNVESIVEKLTPKLAEEFDTGGNSKVNITLNVLPEDQALAFAAFVLGK